MTAGNVEPSRTEADSYACLPLNSELHGCIIFLHRVVFGFDRFGVLHNNAEVLDRARHGKVPPYTDNFSHHVHSVEAVQVVHVTLLLMNPLCIRGSRARGYGE